MKGNDWASCLINDRRMMARVSCAGSCIEMREMTIIERVVSWYRGMAVEIPQIKTNGVEILEYDMAAEECERKISERKSKEGPGEK